jgi:hypothetical protein
MVWPMIRQSFSCGNPLSVMYSWERMGDSPFTEFGEEETPMYLPPIFHPTMVADIPLGRFRVIEYSATFNETRPI